METEALKPVSYTHLDVYKRQAVDTPLVLHGGTGIPQEDIQRAIKEGINKVNVGTIIHCTYMNNLREELNRAGDNPYTCLLYTSSAKGAVSRL